MKVVSRRITDGGQNGHIQDELSKKISAIFYDFYFLNFYIKATLDETVIFQWFSMFSFFINEIKRRIFVYIHLMELQKH